MAVELCKVSLWLESNTPGKPLSFLDHRIICGNSLLGTTPRLMAEGIPDAAFKPLTGDDNEHVSALRKANKKERKDPSQGVLAPEWTAASEATLLASRLHRIDVAADDTAEQVAAKQEEYARLRASAPAEKAKLIADAWCAAFVARKTPADPPITDTTLRALQARRPDLLVLDVWASRQDDGSENAATAIDSIRRLADKYRFTHLHLAFPNVFIVPEDPDEVTNDNTGWSGGFDAIVGNPPWERVKLQGKEYFAQHDPAIATAPTAAVRKRLIADLKSNNPVLRAAFDVALRHAEGISALLCHSDRFPLAGRGDVNTYAVFIELMQDGVSPTGRVGAIVPTGIAADNTTKLLFGCLVDNQRLASLYDFENRKKIFPSVHSGMKFCLLTLTGTHMSTPKATFSFFALDVLDLDNTERQFTLNSQDFSLLNPNTKTCAIFRTARDAEITKAIYGRLPVLMDESNPEGNPWSASLQTMFHMANDSGLFRNRDWLESEGYILEGNRFVLQDGDGACNDGRHADCYVPLYEGKMISMFDHRAADVVQSETAVHRRNQPSYLNSMERGDPCRLPLPASWVAQHRVDEHLQHELGCCWILGYPKVTSPTNARTMSATALPLSAIADSVLTVRSRDQHLLYASLNSFALDYVTRQKIGGMNLNFFIVRQLAVPTPSSIGPSSKFLNTRILELTHCAWDMARFANELGYNGPPFRWDEERRSQIRTEIDALMFHLYGVNRGDADYIMDTFAIVKRQDEDAHGEFRTKRLILDRYDAMTAAFEATHGTPEGTPNGPNPPLDQQSLTTYSCLLADALAANYSTNVDPPPAHPSQAHPASTRPAWVSIHSRPRGGRP